MGRTGNVTHVTTTQTHAKKRKKISFPASFLQYTLLNYEGKIAPKT